MRVLKVIVFVYFYYLKIERSKKLAYAVVMMFFFLILSIAQVFIFSFLNVKIPYVSEKVLEGTKLEGYFSAFLVSLPYCALFYWLYPPKKLELYKDKFTYPKNYIWHLRIGFVLYIVMWMAIRLLLG